MGTGRVPDEKHGHEFVIAENGALPARRFSRSPLYFGIYLHFSITKKKKSLQSALWEDRAPRMFILVVVVGPKASRGGAGGNRAVWTGPAERKPDSGSGDVRRARCVQPPPTLPAGLRWPFRG